MDKKLKIAIIGSRGYPHVYSGYETLVKELSERLVKKGYKVRVYCHSSLFEIKQSIFDFRHSILDFTLIQQTGHLA